MRSHHRYLRTALDVVVASVLVSGCLLSSSARPAIAAVAARLNPAVASNGSKHLVVWTDTRAGNSDIYGTIVSSGGEPGVQFPIAATPASADNPSVAWDGVNFVVAWQGDGSGGPTAVLARVSPTGAVLDRSGVVVARDAYTPTIAGGGPDSLLTWVEGSSRTVRVARVSRAGAVLDPGGRVVGTGTNLHPSAAWHRSAYLVSWSRLATWASWTVAANRVDGSTGSPLDGDGFLVSGPTAFAPRVAGGPGGFLVVWSDFRADPYGLYPYYSVYGRLPPAEDLDLYGARVTDEGKVVDLGGAVIAPARGRQAQAALASDGRSWLLALEDSGPTWTNRQVATTRVSSLPSLRPATVVDPSSPRQSQPSVATDAGGNALVVWRDDRFGEERSEIRGALMTASGTKQLSIAGG